MNYLFVYSSLVLICTCLFLCFLIFKFGKSKLHTIWALFNLSVAWWGVGMFLVGITKEPGLALKYWRFAHVGGLFIPVFFMHVALILSNLKHRVWLFATYSISFFFALAAVLAPTSLYISSPHIVFESILYVKAENNLYILSVFWWLVVLIYGIGSLLYCFKSRPFVKRAQIVYFLIGVTIGFSGGVTYFLPMFGFKIYPIGNFTIPIYCLIVTYAILKHRLLDIRIAITRTGIFVVVYSLVLGLPFAIGFGWQEMLKSVLGKNWWMIPLIASTALATAGPYIYLYIQKRAEDRLLKEQHLYQNTLRRASLGMGRIKNLKRLLELIVHIVARTVRIEHCSIYLLHEDSNQYTLRALKGVVEHQPNQKASIVPSVFPLDSPLVKHIKKVKEPIVYDEISQQGQDFANKDLQVVEAEMRCLGAALIVPSYIEERLISILVLGKKKSGKIYSHDDIVVFSILANQSGLAIENAQFYEDTKRTHEQLFKAEKMATIGTMADGLSHQINNRLHAMGFIAGDALDTIKLKKEKGVSPDDKEMVDEVEHALNRIQDNVKRGGQVVEGLLKYTRKGSEGFEPVVLGKVLEAALEMAQFKIKLNQFQMIKNFDPDIPPVLANFTQLQEVLFNIIDNSYDSMMQKKTTLLDPNYQPTLQIYAIKRGRKLEIVFKDNGMGIKKEDVNKLFTPFFTTKASSKKGTGLGLYVIRQIIEENHGGKVTFTGEHMQGAQTQLLLPVAGEEGEEAV
ncbi:MAG: GAF domain-containing protein [Candidatus Omnitrophica bacterium]|nr:GAF domain-containing protein [Candidatus Omnitrophota bacterium]